MVCHNLLKRGHGAIRLRKQPAQAANAHSFFNHFAAFRIHSANLTRAGIGAVKNLAMIKNCAAHTFTNESVKNMVILQCKAAVQLRSASHIFIDVKNLIGKERAQRCF